MNANSPRFLMFFVVVDGAHKRSSPLFPETAWQRYYIDAILKIQVFQIEERSNISKKENISGREKETPIRDGLAQSIGQSFSYALVFHIAQRGLQDVARVVLRVQPIA